MPFIKLKQSNGEYAWNGRIYQAGVIEEVTNKEAYYLVEQEKIAIGIDSATKEDMDKIAEEKKAQAKLDKDLVKIALIRLGGMGDSLLLCAYAKALKRAFPISEIAIYIRDKFELVDDMESVDRTVVCNNVEWSRLVENTISSGHYDIVVDNRYVTKMYFKDEKRFAKEKALADKCFKPFKSYYDEWIHSCASLAKLSISTFDLFYKSTGLIGSEDDIHIPLALKHFKFSQLLEDGKYVTVHNGSDISRQTKCWPTENWKRVVHDLRGEGYKVIQLGLQYEEKIEGAISLCGTTTLPETAALISKAKFHIDTEGGLVHIAKGVGTRAVVLFGPTPLVLFGYNQNVNVESPATCKGCWWSTDFWWRECPLGTVGAPACMNAITPEMVIAATEKLLQLPPLERAQHYDPNDMNEQFAVELTLNEGHYQSEPHQWDRINKMLEAVKGPKVLEVGAGDGYCSLVLKKRGHDVTATEVSKIRLQRMRDSGLDPIEADVRKLPFQDASFDTVICGEVLEHIPNWWEGMKELERVCKPDGRLILSWPLHPRYDGIQMHLWSVRMLPVNFEGKLDMGVFIYERINRKV